MFLVSRVVAHTKSKCAYCVGIGTMVFVFRWRWGWWPILVGVRKGVTVEHINSIRTRNPNHPSSTIYLNKTFRKWQTYFQTSDCLSILLHSVNELLMLALNNSLKMLCSKHFDRIFFNNNDCLDTYSYADIIFGSDWQPNKFRTLEFRRLLLL